MMQKSFEYDLIKVNDRDEWYDVVVGDLMAGSVWQTARGWHGSIVGQPKKLISAQKTMEEAINLLLKESK